MRTQQNTATSIQSLSAEIEARLKTLPSLKTEPVRAVRREFSRRVAKAPAADVVRLALLLLRNTSSSPRWFGYELIFHHREALRSLRIQHLEQLGKGIASWEAVDTFAGYLSGPAWRERQVSDKEIIRWGRSSDRWWRRAALVSTVPLNRKALGGTGDTKRTLMVCRLLVGDRDDMVAKALSWALRELTKHDRKAVEEFVREYEDALAALVKREVRCKLETGLKNARKKARPG